MRKPNFLTLILTAFFLVGLTVQVNAQADSNATPTAPTDCSENANFPAAGVPHSYEVAINTTAPSPYSGNGTYQWYVTQDATNLLTGAMANGSDFDATAASGVLSAYNSTTTAQTKNKIELTWKPSAVVNGSPYFLVLKYTESNGATCTTQNLKVMKVEPLNRFMLSMVAYDKEAATPTDFTGGDGIACAADVSSAVYDATANKVTYKYGKQTLYYRINAKGFVGEWLPKINLPELLGKQTYASAKIYTNMDASGTPVVLNTLNTTSEGPAAVQELTGAGTLSITDATNGTDYLLEVVINNNTYETKTDQDLATTNNIAVDGTYGTATTAGAVAHTALNDKKDDCSADEAAFADKGKYTIKARPNITATSGGFIQKVD